MLCSMRSAGKAKGKIHGFRNPDESLEGVWVEVVK